MSKPNFEETGRKATCEHCGAPVIQLKTLDGAVYRTAVADDMLLAYFDTVEDVDDFMLDRLRRAERIITSLRKEVKELKESRAKAG